MNSNTKLEIAVEIIAAKIANFSQKYNNANNEGLKRIIDERTEMYKGNHLVIDKIINEYGPEIKSNYKDI